MNSTTSDAGYPFNIEGIATPELEELGKAIAKLHSCITSTLLARKAREQGDIEAARAHELYVDRIYNMLPENHKW